jgi:ParB-like chromosome segregation protein Spo0J
VNEPIEQTRNIDTLVPHPRNYNQHPPAQLERLAASLRQFGQVRPIVVHGDTIVAGHGVYMSAQHLGYQTLRVTQLPDDWTEEQAMAYLVADNETRRGAEPSDTELAALLDELQQQDFDIGAMGFDDAEYSALLDGLTPVLDEDGDDVDQADLWKGMPEFEQEDLTPWKTLHVHFQCMDDYMNFAQLVEQKLTERTRYIWYPYVSNDSFLDNICIDDES